MRFADQKFSTSESQNTTFTIASGLQLWGQGIEFPGFAILAGVLEMIARAGVGIFLVPAMGFAGAALGSPVAWILADAFLIPAYFHVMKKLKARHESE